MAARIVGARPVEANIRLAVGKLLAAKFGVSQVRADAAARRWPGPATPQLIAN